MSKTGGILDSEGLSLFPLIPLSVNFRGNYKTILDQVPNF